MPKITFRDSEGTEAVFEAALGLSLMEVAKAAGIDGIVAECGGSMVCGTCHVYLPAAIRATLPPPSEMEAEMLDWGIEAKPTSRLACQVPVCDELDGAVIEVPARQR